MGFFSRLGGWLSGKNEAEQIQELAADAERFADRFENADMDDEAATCRGYAERIAAATNLDQAELIHEEFLEVVEKFEDHHYLHGRDQVVRNEQIDDDTTDTLSDDS